MAKTSMRTAYGYFAKRHDLRQHDENAVTASNEAEVVKHFGNCLHPASHDFG
jgi:hypothetical protein